MICALCNYLKPHPSDPQRQYGYVVVGCVIIISLRGLILNKNVFCVVCLVLLPLESSASEPFSSHFVGLFD